MRVRAVHTSLEGARVTTFELFFDLVFVFAFTQVTRLMAHGHTGFGVLQGVVVLALLWWTWVSYSWLANQARADRGLVRVGMIAATLAIFVVALAVPEAFHDVEGGLDAPVVLVTAYLLARLIHGGVYLAAASGDAALQRQLLVTGPLSIGVSGVLLYLGAFADDELRVWWWLAALVADGIIVYTTARIGWHVQSAAHWSERYGLIVILALGESIVAIGAGVAQLPIDVPIVLGSAFAVLVSFGMWWAYFARIAESGERSFARTEGAHRVRLATDAYTYLHFLLVAGIILAALGVELAMAHVADSEPFGLLGALALGGGVALFLAGTFLFHWRISARREWLRLGWAGLALASTALLAVVTPLGALGVAVAVAAVGVLLEWAARRSPALADDERG